MLGRQLNVGRKFAPANVLGAFTSRRKRTARWQVRQIRRQPGNLIELALLIRRIGHRSQKAARVRIARSLEQLGGRRLFEDLAGVHHDDVIGHAGDDTQVVCDQNDAGPRLSLQTLYEFQNLCLDGDVQRRRGFVGNQEFGPAREGHRDHHALAHPA